MMEFNRNLGGLSGRGRGDYDDAVSAATGISREKPPSSISLTDLHTTKRSQPVSTTGEGDGGSTKTTPIVDNFLSMIPMGHEKAMRYAFYNVLAMILAGFLLFMLWGAYCVLNPFLKSLLWAVLIGTVLYPFKKNLSGVIRQWLQNGKKSSVPFVIRLVTAPIVVVDNLSDAIGSTVISSWKSTLAGLILFIVTYFVYYNPPSTVVAMGQWIGCTTWGLLIWTLQWVVNLPIVIALNTLYIGHVVTSSFKSKEKPGSSGNDVSDSTGNKKEDKEISKDPTPGSPESQPPPQSREGNQLLAFVLPYLALVVTFMYVCLNVLPYSLLISLVIFVTLGIVTYLQGDGQEASSNKSTDQQKVIPSVLSHYAALVALNIGVTSPVSSPIYPGTVEERRTRLQKSWSEGSAGSGSGSLGRKLSSKEPSDRSIPEGFLENSQAEAEDIIDSSNEASEAFVLDSNKFLYGVSCAICVVQIWRHPWIMHLLPLPVVYYGIKKLCKRTGINDYFDNKVRTPIKEFIDRNTGVSKPSSEDDENKVLPFHLIFRILRAGDYRLVSICEDCLDPVASMLVLTLVGIAAVLGFIFVSVQIYSEADHLVRVSIDLINSTVSQYPEINAMLPDGWESIMTSMVSNAYHYGRETITNTIRDSIADKNPEKAEQIERQLIELWDKVYETWNQTWGNSFPGQRIMYNDTNGKGVDWDELLETGKEMPHLVELSVLTNYAKANVGTLWSILESVWNIVISNISLVFSAITSVVSVLFGGGTAILNLILNFVIFFTALFYLLSSSTDVYKPVELVNYLSPARSNGNGSRASGFAKAVEDAVNGVFAASFKMAAFYGMWTWLIHTLFEVQIVFLPTISAAIFGAVPILAPYCAALPAVLELWLIQGHWGKALFMFLAQMSPMSMVDTQIYSEIKGGGHPYLTGLAIAGGIFYFGMQGAIMGPVILCCVFVAVKVATSFMREDDPGSRQVAVK